MKNKESTPTKGPIGRAIENLINLFRIEIRASLPLGNLPKLQADFKIRLRKNLPPKTPT